MPAAAQGVCRVCKPEACTSDTPPDVAVALVAAEQHGVIAASQLRAAGLNRTAVAVRVRNARLHRIHHGVYAIGHDALSLRGRFMAAVLACGPEAVLSHRSAAALWGFLDWDEARHPEVTVRGSAARDRPGLRAHRTRTLRPRDITRRRGIPVTTPARALLDLAGELPPKGCAGPPARRRRCTGPTCARSRTFSGAPAAAATLAALVADGPAPTRSEFEDLVLALILGAGLRRPAQRVIWR